MTATQSALTIIGHPATSPLEPTHRYCTDEELLVASGWYPGAACPNDTGHEIIPTHVSRKPASGHRPLDRDCWHPVRRQYEYLLDEGVVV